METSAVMVQVTEPTEWASDMVVVTKGEKESVRYLGHVLTRDGLSLNPQRLEDILQVQTPSNQKELQMFLAMSVHCTIFGISSHMGIAQRLRHLRRVLGLYCTTSGIGPRMNIVNIKMLLPNQDAVGSSAGRVLFLIMNDS
ncbi:uncharacterized protein [Dermacentor albipictus]|uniref:uncharacterized protein n=1 Tax=Dermacentor albipictus TaxID=60249 RepID=UPI0031FD5E94